MQRRKVKMSLCAPVSATVVVERESEDDDWRVAYVDEVNCELSARGITEHAADEDLAEMSRRADAAEDLP